MQTDVNPGDCFCHFQLVFLIGENRKNNILVFRCWFLNAVAVAGTLNTFMFLKQRIQNEELSTMESAITLVLALHVTKPDGPTLRAAAVSILFCGIHFPNVYSVSKQSFAPLKKFFCLE